MAISTADPDISPTEIAAVVDAMSQGTLSTGEIVAQFEDEVADLIGREHGAAVCSGGVGLELAFEVSELSPGDGVVVSPRNCAAVLYSILNSGLVPVFADVRPEGINIDPDAIRAAIERAGCSVGGVLVTHLSGIPCDMDGLLDVAAERDLELIEDICQCLGGSFADTPVGSFGSLAVCSFGATKTLTTAEGGMVVGDDRERIELVRLRRSSRHGEADEPLQSVRMSDLEAAMGLEQLNRYDAMLDRRRSVAARYREELPTPVSFPTHTDDTTPVYHNYPVFVDDPLELQSYLADHDIETATFEKLLSEFDCLDPTPDFRFPNSQRLVDETIVLPMHSQLSTTAVSRVIDTVDAFIG